MNQEVINEVLCQMIPHLSNDQVVLLKNVLEGVMLKNGIASEQTDEMLVDSFIAAKRLEGCSERTLTFYKNTIEKMLKAGIDVTLNPSRNTVFFENIYGDNPNDRKQRVLAKADPLAIG